MTTIGRQITVCFRISRFVVWFPRESHDTETSALRATHVRTHARRKRASHRVAVTMACAKYLRKFRGVAFMQYKSSARPPTIFARFLSRPPRRISPPDLAHVIPNEGRFRLRNIW